MRLHDDFLNHRNDEATSDLLLGVEIIAHTAQSYAAENLQANLLRDVPWLVESPANDRIAVVCGASPSLAEHIEQIRSKRRDGAVIYACNAAAQVLAGNGIACDFQVILDPLEITVKEFEPSAKCHLLASVVNPVLFDMAQNPTLWHFCSEDVINAVDGIARNFTYIGGGVTVSMSALCIAYTLGHRSIEAYGMDSSYAGAFYADGKSLESTGSTQLRVAVEHAGRSFKTTWDMKQQVIVFLKLAHALQTAGVSIGVYGDGLLPHAWKNPQQENQNANSTSPASLC